MSASSIAVHVATKELESVVAAVKKRYARQGFEPVDFTAPGEPRVERVRVVAGERWTSLAVQDLLVPDGWAKHLSKELACPALGVEAWEDESAMQLQFFEGGRKASEVEIPRDAHVARVGRRSGLGGEGSLAVGVRERASAASIQSEWRMTVRVCSQRGAGRRWRDVSRSSRVGQGITQRWRGASTPWKRSSG